MPKRFRYTNVPSLIQGAVPEDEAWCYLSGLHTNIEFHHIMNGPYRKKSEKYGCWVWLNSTVHFNLHNTREGKQWERSLKAKCQLAFINQYSMELWMDTFHRSYL